MNDTSELGTPEHLSNEMLAEVQGGNGALAEAVRSLGTGGLPIAPAFAILTPGFGILSKTVVEAVAATVAATPAR